LTKPDCKNGVGRGGVAGKSGGRKKKTRVLRTGVWEIATEM